MEIITDLHDGFRHAESYRRAQHRRVMRYICHQWVQVGSDKWKQAIRLKQLNKVYEDKL